MKNEMRREVRFEVGHNCMEFECKFDASNCKPGNGGSHGISGMTIRFLVHGDQGCVQFVLGTGWQPTNESYLNDPFSETMPYYLGYHSRVQMYEGQPMMEACEFLEDVKCYHGGNILNAELAFRTLINKGEEDLWRFLNEYYKNVFEDSDFPKTGEYERKERLAVEQSD